MHPSFLFGFCGCGLERMVRSSEEKRKGHCGKRRQCDR